VSFKVAGLGDVQDVYVSLSVAEESFVEFVCLNRGNNVPRASNKQFLQDEIVSTTLRVRNGQTTGSVAFSSDSGDFSYPPGR
jgi:hypothetical protein